MPPTRAFPLLVTAVAFVGATACGLSVTGTGTGGSAQAEVDPTTTLRDGAVSPDADTPAQATTFPCGSDTCATGIQACCATGTTFACSAPDAGCPVSDSDAAPPPPIWCTSSSECNGERLCCFGKATGSSCAKSCGTDQVELCRVGLEGCGENGRCIAMTVSPAPAVGQCDYSRE